MEDKNIPNEFLCPITLTIMKEPYIMPDGQTYEKEAIKKALEITHVSPITKAPMKFSEGKINYSIKSLIEKYVKENNFDLNIIDEKIKNLKFEKNEEKIEKIEFDHLEARFIPKEINTFDDYVHICMKPKKINTTSPICLICVVDVSGSMCQNCCQNIENMETMFVSRLSLIKHSLKTIVSTLRKNDMISIITFSNEAKMLKQPTVLLNKNIKNEINSIIDSMYEDGMTNMWSGIKLAIDTLESFPYNNYQKSIMVFTDGESNCDPPEGILPTLKSTLKTCNKKNFTISTFSFGNDINPDLLVDISKVGNGIYGYCPDGSMVGTIFINYMANLLSTITSVVKVSLCQNDQKKSVTIGPLYRGCYRNALLKCDKTLLSNSKVIVELPIIEQTFDIHIDLETKTNLQEYIKEMSEIENKNKKEVKDNNDEILDDDSTEDEGVENIDNINVDAIIPEQSNNIKYEEILFNQLYRNKFILILNKLIHSQKLEEDKNELTEFFNHLNQLEYKSKFIKSLIIDIENPDPNHGQISKAISKQYFGTWGRCYLSSFLRFHLFEQCGNFKDQTLQYYAGYIFSVYRKIGNSLFINIPPPKQNIIYNNSNNNNNSLNMHHFMNRHGGCFNGEALVLLANGQTKCVKDLKKNDKLINNSIVQCVIEQKCNKKNYMCNINGILFTPYHPININNKWHFPIDLVEKQIVFINSWFNLILKDEFNKKFEIEFYNGVKAIALGHNRNENKILEHPYFGTNAVLMDLYERDPVGFENGYIFIDESNLNKVQLDENQYCVNYYKI